MALKEYTAKREFTKTPEPAPGGLAERGVLHFVVHKHAARVVHYDLRLELDGVLKSWAVPKGPTLDPSVKRLAVMVEDHPLEYEDFEGVIPEGNYGAGSVIIWDRGIYRHPSAARNGSGSGQLREGLRKGDLKFVLEGEKLRGEFALVRTRKDERTWLLLKKRDGASGSGPALRDNRSVASHRTLEEVLASARPDRFLRVQGNRIRLREALESGALAEAPAAGFPRGLRPMLAMPVRAPFDHPDWIYEVKWDGYRALAELHHGEVRVYSRNGVPFTGKYPLIVASLRKAGFDALLDGEIVVVDDAGLPDFQALQQYREQGAGHLLYYVFDLLHLEGHDLTPLPLERRKELLRRVLPVLPGIRYSDHVRAEGILFYRAAVGKGLEGIVAKDGTSPYEPGRRSRSWLKVKTRLTRDAVIAGFTAPNGARPSFGSLVLGAYDRGRLTYIGSVGSGFSEQDLRELGGRLAAMAANSCPFDREPETPAAVTWVRPELVCEVTLSEWTADEVMRHPVFLRLREDRDARDVLRERS